MCRLARPATEQAACFWPRYYLRFIITVSGAMVGRTVLALLSLVALLPAVRASKYFQQLQEFLLWIGIRSWLQSSGEVTEPKQRNLCSQCTPYYNMFCAVRMSRDARSVRTSALPTLLMLSSLVSKWMQWRFFRSHSPHVSLSLHETR
jgi:hypothetical protein